MADLGGEKGNRLNDVEVSTAERLVALFEHLQAGVALHEVVCDSNGQAVDYRILDVNTAFERHTGLKRTDVVGQLASVLHGTGVIPYLKEFCSVGMGGPPTQFDAYFAPLGRHFNVSVTPIGPRGFATLISDVTLSKRQAEALEKVRLSQRALLDNLPHLAWLKDCDGRFLAVNQTFANACGQLNPDALVGKTDHDVWPPELAEAYRSDDAAVIAAGAQKVAKEWIETVSGTRWVETYKAPVFAPDGSVVGTTGVARDITEQQRAEVARTESELKFEKVFDLAPDPIAVTTLTGEMLYINRAFCKATGYSRAEMLGRRTADLGVWKDPEVRARAVEQLKNEGHFDAVEMCLTSKSGEHRYMEMSGAYTEIDGHNVMITAARDITEHRIAQKNAEQARNDLARYLGEVARSREQLLRVAELAHIGHFTIDVDTQAVTWTPELYRVLGFVPDSFVPTVALGQACIHPDDLPAVEAAIAAAAQRHESASISHRIVRPSGEVRNCLCIVEGEVDPSGKTRVVALVQDLTELRRAEEEQHKLEQQVMQAQKLESLGVLAGGIAHDFNNLLTSILGNADLARSELSENNPACVYLEDIEKVSRRAADLCRQMLAYSGKGRFVVQPISLNEIVREMAYLLTVSISKKVVIKYSFFPDLPSVMADATQVRQVVMNLITNASEAINEVSGVVTLSTGVMDCDAGYLLGSIGYHDVRPAGQYVYLEVSDTGSGMSSATLSRIFDPFFTTKFTGRGLGLAAVLGIVRGHKGALRVYSEEGKGTTFKVLFPAHHASAQPSEATTAAPMEWSGHGLVLLADDEESIRSMGRHLLERAGFEVITAADGREAVELFTAHRGQVRLVVLDMTMPHLDGEGCFRELRRIEPQVKVIMTSGYNEQDVVNRFAGKGLAAFVQKPYKASDLLPTVREVLGEGS